MPVSPIPLLQHLDGQGAATVKGLPSPEAETDAANKAYVDEKVRRIKAPAAQAISGHRAVFISANDEADYPQVARQIDGLTIVGVSAGAAAQGDDVEIYTAGAITEPGWNWTSGPVFAGNLACRSWSRHWRNRSF